MLRLLSDEKPSLKIRLNSAKRLLLITDFDGTLTPIMNHPGDVQLAPSARDLLKEFHAKPNCDVAVISGRSLADIRTRIGINDLVYSGNHGFEIAGPGFEFCPVNIREFRPSLVTLLKRVREAVSSIPGVLVEDKGITASVHVRNTDNTGRARVSWELGRLLPESPRFHMTHGNMVHEIRPNFDWHKGRAAQWLINRIGLPTPLTICIGDDRTDEDAFRTLADAITVRVGFTPGSDARYFVHSSSEALAFIRWILDNKY